MLRRPLRTSPEFQHRKLPGRGRLQSCDPLSPKPPLPETEPPSVPPPRVASNPQALKITLLGDKDCAFKDYTVAMA